MGEINKVMGELRMLSFNQRGQVSMADLQKESAVLFDDSSAVTNRTRRQAVTSSVESKQEKAERALICLISRQGQQDKTPVIMVTDDWDKVRSTSIPMLNAIAWYGYDVPFCFALMCDIQDNGEDPAFWSNLSCQLDEGGMSLMGRAMRGLCPTVVAELLSMGISQMQSMGAPYSGFLPMHVSILYKREDLYDVMSHHATASGIDEAIVLSRPGDQDLISIAACFGRTDVVRWGLSLRNRLGDKIDLKRRYSAGQTLMHFAALWGSPSVVRLLIEAGVPVDETNESGHTPLTITASQAEPNIEVVKLMLANGAKVLPLHLEMVSRLGSATSQVFRMELLRYDRLEKLSNPQIKRDFDSPPVVTTTHDPIIVDRVF